MKATPEPGTLPPPFQTTPAAKGPCFRCYVCAMFVLGEGKKGYSYKFAQFLA